MTSFISFLSLLSFISLLKGRLKEVGQIFHALIGAQIYNPINAKEIKKSLLHAWPPIFRMYNLKRVIELEIKLRSKLESRFLVQY